MSAKVVAFQRYNLRNIPEALRLLARQIEDGEVNPSHCIVAMDSYEDIADYRVFGNEITVAHGIGLLHLVAHRITRDMIE